MNPTILFLILVPALCSLELSKSNSIPLFRETENIMALVTTNTFASISVRKGTLFAIELPSNPTTGYMWILENTKGITLFDEDKFGTFGERSSPLDGAPTVQTFALMPTIGGQIDLIFKYKRAWEDDPEPAMYKVKLAVN